MKRRAFLASLPGVALAASPQGKGKGKAKKARAAPGFLREEQRIILGYFQNPPSGLPPGLGKRGGDLPPGLEKQVRRKGQLPPGLQKRLAPFPPDLAGRLGPLPEGHERGILGDLAIVWSPRTGLIVDVLVLAGR
jgi:hypothetical protein